MPQNLEFKDVEILPDAPFQFFLRTQGIQINSRSTIWPHRVGTASNEPDYGDNTAVWFENGTRSALPVIALAPLCIFLGRSHFSRDLPVAGEAV